MAVDISTLEEIQQRGHPLVRSSSSVGEMLSQMVQYRNKRNCIFAWKKAFASTSILQLMEEQDWPAKMVALFGNATYWPWKFKLSGEAQDHVSNEELLTGLNENKKAFRNLTASLKFRDFANADEYAGSARWLRDIVPLLHEGQKGAMELIKSVQRSLALAENSGLKLYIEKMSLILRQDENAPAVTLTPHLHTDREYGVLEAGVCSLFSDRQFPNSSTIVFPEMNLNEHTTLKPITAEKMISHHTHFSGIRFSSGDLVVFSGKKDETGIVVKDAGVPHISPEGFSLTKRIALLFRVAF